MIDAVFQYIKTSKIFDQKKPRRAALATYDNLGKI
jgi:hypothetical protein